MNFIENFLCAWGRVDSDKKDLQPQYTPEKGLCNGYIGAVYKCEI